jgi:hypothetical protein
VLEYSAIFFIPIRLIELDEEFVIFLKLNSLITGGAGSETLMGLESLIFRLMVSRSLVLMVYLLTDT